MRKLLRKTSSIATLVLGLYVGLTNQAPASDREEIQRHLQSAINSYNSSHENFQIQGLNVNPDQNDYRLVSIYGTSIGEDNEHGMVFTDSDGDGIVNDISIDGYLTIQLKKESEKKYNMRFINADNDAKQDYALLEYAQMTFNSVLVSITEYKDLQNTPPLVHIALDDNSYIQNKE